jgi:hypothetical protein
MLSRCSLFHPGSKAQSSSSIGYLGPDLGDFIARECCCLWKFVGSYKNLGARGDGHLVRCGVVARGSLKAGETTLV